MSSTRNPSSCVFCKASFSRPDALKRHWTTCKVRLAESWELPQVSSKARGRKRKACDRCARQKRACVLKNNRQTCQPCAVHNKECSYRRVADAATEHQDQPNDPNYVNLITTGSESTTNEFPSGISVSSVPQSGVRQSPCRETVARSNSSFDIANQGISWTIYQEFTLGRSQNRRPTELNISHIAEFPFLGRLAKAYGFVGTFECGSFEHRSTISKRLWKPYAYRDVSELWKRALPSGQVFSNYTPSMQGDGLNLLTATNLHDFSNNPKFGEPPKKLNATSMTQASHAYSVGTTTSEHMDVLNVASNLDTFPGQGDDDALLSIKTYEIVNAIRNAIMDKPKNSTITVTWSYRLEAMCYEFFCPTNIEKFLALYWSCWYPNWPTIHQPTFDSVTADFILVTAMVILGACLSPDQRDRATANIWFNVVEEIIFNHEVFSGNTTCEDQDNNTRALLSSHINILQAAYCACLYQTWEGSKESKRRVRRYRFNSIIWVSETIICYSSKN